MAINTSKVIVGGLVGGVVMNVIDFAAQSTVLAGPAHESMMALNPKLAAMTPSGGQVAGFVLIDFLWMLVTVWLYAAARPRFGPGPRTATYVAIATWLLGSCVAGYFVVAGMVASGLYWEQAAIELVTGLIATNVGAMLYREAEPA